MAQKFCIKNLEVAAFEVEPQKNPSDFLQHNSQSTGLELLVERSFKQRILVRNF